MEFEERPEVLAGERIYLSHIVRSDLGAFKRWFADLELTVYLGQPGMSYRPEHEESWYDEMVSSTRGTALRTFGIMVRDGNQLIGSVSLMDINAANGTAELGIAIGERSMWGQGYGTEAVRLITEYGFTFLNLQTVYLWHAGFNARGRRAYEKAGFRDAGRIRNALVFDGQRYDKMLMDCTRTDLGPSRLRAMIGQLDR